MMVLVRPEHGRGDGRRCWALMTLAEYRRWRDSVPEGPFRVDGVPFASGGEFLGRTSVTRLGSRLASFLGRNFGPSSGGFPTGFRAEDDRVTCPGCGEPTTGGEVDRGLCRGCLRETVARNAA